MKKFVALFLILLTLILIQQSFLPVLFNHVYYVNLYLAFVMALLFVEKEEEALAGALVGGFINDALTTNMIGFSSLVVIPILLVLIYTKRFFYRIWLIRTFLALVVFYVYMLAVDVPGRMFVQNMLISGGITLLAFFVFKYLVSRIFNEKRFS